MHRLTRLTGALGALALTITAAVSGAQAAALPSAVVGHVYVNDNTAGMNTIAGFDRHADGTLTAMAGSPFAAGGAGSGAQTGSQGALQIADNGRYLLAADAGSNQISVLRILPGGALSPVAGSPVLSGGREPVSIAVHNHLVYVANTGDGGANYTGFVLTPGGRLLPLTGSSVALPDGSGLGDVLFSPDGTRLVGTRVNTSLIDSFAVNRFGRLIAAPNEPFVSPVAGPFGSEFRPTDSSQLFVSNAHGGTGNGSISAYSVAGNGDLSTIGSGPFPDGQTAPCWVEISADGRYLFTSNTGSDAISSYAIATDGTLTLLGSTVLKGTPGVGPFDLRLDPSGRTLYVVDTGTLAVSALSVSGGTLSELAGSPVALPSGVAPFGLVVD